VSVLLAIGLLESIDLLEPWHVYTAIATTAVTQVFFSSTAAALTPAVRFVPERHLLLAVTTQTATQSGGAIVGPLIFALVAGTLGLTAAFLAATFITAPAVVLP